MQVASQRSASVFLTERACRKQTYAACSCRSQPRWPVPFLFFFPLSHRGVCVCVVRILLGESGNFVISRHFCLCLESCCCCCCPRIDRYDDRSSPSPRRGKKQKSISTISHARLSEGLERTIKYDRNGHHSSAPSLVFSSLTIPSARVAERKTKKEKKKNNESPSPAESSSSYP